MQSLCDTVLGEVWEKLNDEDDAGDGVYGGDTGVVGDDEGEYGEYEEAKLWSSGYWYDALGAISLM